MIYFYTIGLCILFSLVDFLKLKEKKILKFTLLFCMTIILILISGLRNKIGNDYTSYKAIYDHVSVLNTFFSTQKIFFNQYVEYGYLLLNSIVKTIFHNFNIVLFIMALLTTLFVIRSCWKYSNFIFLSVFLYFTRFYFARDMGQIRSGLVCALFLYSLEMIKKREFFKFLFLIICGSFFHTVILIALPFYFFAHYELKNVTYFIFLLICILLGIFVPIKDIVMNSNLFFMDNKIISYMYSGYGESLTLFYPVFWMQIVILILFIIYKDKLREKVYDYSTMLNMYMFSTCWLAIFNQLGILGARVATVFTTIEILIIPSFLLITKNKTTKIFIYLLIIAMGLIIFYLKIIHNNVYSLYFPYKCILF